VKLKLKYFLFYLHDQEDDSPLYLFDSSFAERDGRKELLDDYRVSQFVLRTGTPCCDVEVFMIFFFFNFLAE
jgi:hypothetical protein